MPFSNAFTANWTGHIAFSDTDNFSNGPYFMYLPVAGTVKWRDASDNDVTETLLAGYHHFAVKRVFATGTDNGLVILFLK